MNRDALADAAQRFARRFVAAPRAALAMSKSLLNKSFDPPTPPWPSLEGQAQAIAAAAPDHAKAVASFLAAKPAAFDWDRMGKEGR